MLEIEGSQRSSSLNCSQLVAHRTSTRAQYSLQNCHYGTAQRLRVRSGSAPWVIASCWSPRHLTFLMQGDCGSGVWKGLLGDDLHQVGHMHKFQILSGRQFVAAKERILRQGKMSYTPTSLPAGLRESNLPHIQVFLTPHILVATYRKFIQPILPTQSPSSDLSSALISPSQSTHSYIPEQGSVTLPVGLRQPQTLLIVAGHKTMQG